ncbi:hypothetical protein [Fodinicurvata sp. EGI_FJ10296]|uniref:hypothetical protein n=1 Tax=Fodinicurvata sp. EGI_FJ10296 TaxID=3231908 RepID=UPI0034566280
MSDSEHSPSDSSPSGDEQKRIALERILDAWDAALSEGVQPELLATTAIFAALTDMVDLHGEEDVASMMADLPDRIRNGEFSLKRDT